MTSMDDYELNWADVAADEMAFAVNTERLLTLAEKTAAERARQARLLAWVLIGTYAAIAAIAIIGGVL